MKLIVFLTLATLASCSYYTRSKPFDINAWTALSVYPLKIYRVQTSDGFILKLFYITSSPTNQTYASKNRATDRPVVFLMHGMMSNGVDFAYGVDQGLVINLVNNGFDVYVGNMRGSSFGMEHTRLNPTSDTAFWQFSFDEIATKDLPALVDMVLELSGQEKISYIGHMEGTMVFYMMLAEMPDYVNKFDRMVSLGPMAFMKNSQNQVLQKIIDNHDSQEWMIKNVGQNMFYPSEELLQETRLDCENSDSNFRDKVCDNYYFLIKGYDSNNLNATTLYWVVLNVPFGGSVNQFKHLAQMMDTGRFQKYSPDWSGATDEYELSNVKVPMALFYTPNDPFSQQVDVQTLISRLPSGAMNQLFADLTNNIDFLYSENVASIVYEPAMKFLKQTSNPSTYSNKKH